VEEDKIGLSVCYKANHPNRPLPPDLTISPKPMHKRTILIAIVAIVVVISSFVYFTLHNTFIVSVSLADDNIITSDGRGLYKHQVDGVWLEYESYFLIDVNSPRVVHVSFMDASWKDANLRFMPSRLPSSNYWMDLILQEKDQTGRYVDLFEMEVGEKDFLPELQIQIFFIDPSTSTIVGIDTIHEKGGFFTQFYNTTWINSTTAEPPQSLRDESRIELTRTREDTWVLDVDAWLVSYYGPHLYTGNMKDYVKLSLNLTINKKRAM